MAQPSKNAVMVVQELCVKSGESPKYTENQVTPPTTNPPVFRTTCEIIFGGNEYSATADANTKKGAKLKACETLLYNSKLSAVLNMNDPETKKIFGIVDRRLETVLAAVEMSTTATTSDQKLSCSSDDAEPIVKQARRISEKEDVSLVVEVLSDYAKDGNPIADLAVFCDKHGLSLPEYDDGPKAGPPHRVILSVECRIESLGFSLFGVHLVKKTAKRIVAEKMLTELKRRVDIGEIKLPQTGEPAEVEIIEIETESDVDVETETYETENGEDKVSEDIDEIDFEARLKEILSFSAEEELQCVSLTEDNSPPPSGSDSDSDSDEMEFIAKSMGDLMNRKSLDKLLENEYIKLRDMGGPRVQEMISFAKEVNRKYPLEAKPVEKFKTWMQAHELGISGFFSAIEDELNMKVETATIERPKESDNENRVSNIYMILLHVDVPQIQDNPSAVIFDDDVESGKLNAMVEIIMYMGLMAVGY